MTRARAAHANLVEVEMELIEYRVRPVMRYVVTRYEEGMSEAARCSVSTVGEFDNPASAEAVGYALCKAEHERLGWPLDDSRIIYPKPHQKNNEPECVPAHFSL